MAECASQLVTCKSQQARQDVRAASSSPEFMGLNRGIGIALIRPFLHIKALTGQLVLAQQQRSLDSIVSNQQRAGSARRARKEAGLGTELDGDSSSPMSEQDSGILDVEDEEDEEVLGAQDLVDFSPVYRCLHIYTVLSYCTDPNLVLDLKNLIVLFADTLQGFGFPVNQLFDMLLEIRDQYSEILLKKWTVVFRQILDQDNYSPIPVVSEEVYRKTAGQFPFQDPELEKGARDTFENYYRKQRRKQARLVLQPHSNMGARDTFENYYRKQRRKQARFFVVEDHILHTTQGLVNRAYVDELWDLALSKTIAALRTHSSYCTDPNLVLDLKNLIVLFADTLQGFGFPVNQLFDMLLEIRDQYSEILLKKWTVVFRKVLFSLPFPKKFPFSEFVPKVYSQLKEFIYACLKFSEDLHLSCLLCLKRSAVLAAVPPLFGCAAGFKRKTEIQSSSATALLAKKQKTATSMFQKSTENREARCTLNFDLPEAFVYANIPLVKLGNQKLRPLFRLSLGNCGVIPPSAQLRHEYLPKAAEFHKQEIMELVKQSGCLSVVTDESTDDGLHIVFVLQDLIGEHASDVLELKAALADTLYLQAVNYNIVSQAIV
ncbi:UNVERIFIED_CONTAM: hypothetical protein FKN15_064589 [Acipenser sinensis]